MASAADFKASTLLTQLLRTSTTTNVKNVFDPVKSSCAGPDSEYGLLTKVLLASPRNLRIIPCNEVSKAALKLGLPSCGFEAERQHRMLADVLAQAGVDVKIVPPEPNLPDLAFTRDTTLMTPWGLVGLRPGAAHRRAEVAAVLETARGAGIPILGRLQEGSIEGGDVCLLRPGELVIGVSGERTNSVGANALARIFEERGWRVTRTPVRPDLLHLDTHFCVVARETALACIDALDPAFVDWLRGLEIQLIPVLRGEVETLGCNVLALGGRKVLSTGSAPRVDKALRELGFEVITTPLSQFTQCGGGVHCLTMPIRRAPAPT